MISEKSDNVVKLTKKSLNDLTFKIVCDLVDLKENQVDEEALRAELKSLIIKHLKNIKL